MTYMYGVSPWDTDGPREVWLDTQAVFTPEIRERLQEAAQTRTNPPCPRCERLVEAVDYESVAVQQEMYGSWKTEGVLVTLTPCGCRMRTPEKED